MGLCWEAGEAVGAAPWMLLSVLFHTVPSHPHLGKALTSCRVGVQGGFLTFSLPRAKQELPAAEPPLLKGSCQPWVSRDARREPGVQGGPEGCALTPGPRSHGENGAGVGGTQPCHPLQQF